jgi:Domain of unknown function (DUF4136)
MRFIQPLSVLPVLLVLTTSLYAQDVHYNYDRSANFAAYKTYQWVDLPGPGGAVQDQLIDQSIKRAVDGQLAQEGLTRVETGADLYIGYHAVITEEKGINLSAFGTGGGPWGWGGGSGGFDTATVTGQTSTIPVGTLLVDLYDPARKELVWRGDGTKTIDLKKDPDKNYRTLQKMCGQAFQELSAAGRQVRGDLT